MKKITVTVKPAKVDTVLEELQTVKGLLGVSIVQCQGFEHVNNLEEDELIDLVHYTKIEIIAKDERVELIHRTIVDAIHTGFTGDGSIVVTDVDSMFLIGTKEYL